MKGKGETTVRDRPCVIVLEAHSEHATGYIADAEQQKTLLIAEDDEPVRAAKVIVRHLKGHRRLRVVACAYRILQAGASRKEVARECGEASALIGAEVARRGAA
jgi:hypothetical protein